MYEDRRKYRAATNRCFVLQNEEHWVRSWAVEPVLPNYETEEATKLFGTCWSISSVYTSIYVVVNKNM